MLRELSRLIMERRTKDEEIGLVSVTAVQLSPDMSGAAILVSPFGGDEENEATWKALKRNAHYFQSTMSRNLRLRRTPELRFEIDNSIKEGDRMLDKLDS